MLFELKKRNIGYSEVPIETVYLDENKSSHFRTFTDSFKIYKLILAFCLSSLMSTLAEMVIFYLLIKFAFGDNHAILWATVIARVCSSLINFTVNRAKVFDGLWEKAESQLKAAGVNDAWQEDAHNELKDLAEGIVRSEAQGLKR